MIVNHDRPFDDAHATLSSGHILLSDISPSDGRWCHHKALADSISDLLRDTEFHPQSLRIDDCFRFPVFRQIQDLQTGEIIFKLHAAKFCRAPRCPVCQVSKMRLWLAKTYGLSDKLYGDYPNAQFVFLTLTIKNCHVTDLRSTINLMTSAWKRLLKLSDYPGLGFLKTLEVTRQYDCPHEDKHNSPKHRLKRPCRDCLATDYVHPHFHCLIMVPPSYFTSNRYLSHAVWSDLWRQCLRVEYTPIINIKGIKRTFGSDTSLSKAFKETIKYCVKPQDLLSGTGFTGLNDKDFAVELTRQLYKLRSISTGGLLKDYLAELKEEYTDEELIHFENGEELQDNQAKADLLNFLWTRHISNFIHFPINY